MRLTGYPNVRKPPLIEVVPENVVIDPKPVCSKKRLSVSYCGVAQGV